MVLLMLLGMSPPNAAMHDDNAVDDISLPEQEIHMQDMMSYDTSVTEERYSFHCNKA